MNHRPHLRLVAALLAGSAFCLGANQSLAQLGVDVTWTGGGADANWLTGANWDTGIPPAGFFFDRAFLPVGPTAIVDSDLASGGNEPGGVVIGDTADQAGGVEVVSGGNFPVTLFSGDTNTPGDLIVGSGQGVGTFTVSGTGTAGAELLSSGGLAGSGIFLSDTASLTVNTSSTLDSALQINGDGVTFNTGSLALGGSHSYHAVAPSGSVSTIGVTGAASLGGSLNLDLTGAAVPTSGTTYDLIRAGSVSGSFGSFTTTGVTLNSGQKFILGNVPDGGETLVQAEVVDVLVLQIDRDAQTMTIANPTGASISFDGYQVQSGVGSLNQAGFAGLASQSIGDWEESNLGPNQLAELNPLGSSDGSTSYALGTAYAQNMDDFAVDPDDHTFTYRTTSGDLIEGVVEYTGTKVTNNFVLRIDPATGEGVLFNDSATSLTIDGYTIKSASESLDDAGFSGLGGDWVNSNPLPGQLTELYPEEGGTTIAPGSMVSLGTVFDTTGTQDAEFQFLFADVEGGSDDNADFDGSNFVDGADLLTLQRSIGVDAGGDANGDGVTDGADQAIWDNQFGGAPGGGSSGPGGDPNAIQTGIVQYQSLGAAAAVPEPSSVALVCFSALALLAARRRQA